MTPGRMNMKRDKDVLIHVVMTCTRDTDRFSLYRHIVVYRLLPPCATLCRGQVGVRGIRRTHSLIRAAVCALLETAGRNKRTQQGIGIPDFGPASGVQFCKLLFWVDAHECPCFVSALFDCTGAVALSRLVAVCT